MEDCKTAENRQRERGGKNRAGESAGEERGREMRKKGKSGRQ